MSAKIKDNQTPLYIQIRDLIVKQIKEDVIKPGEKIPSERELCNLYNVSRITVRQSLNELVQEGLLYRTHGKGTYVSQPKVEQELVTVTPFRNTLLSKGLNPQTRLLECMVINNSYKISKILNASLSEKLVQLSLMGLDDETPMVLYTSCFTTDLGNEMYELAKQASIENLSFSTLDLYKKIPVLTLGTINQTFEASIADTTIARELQIKKGSPILIVESIIYTNKDQPIEFKTAIYRGDKYKFSVVRKV